MSYALLISANPAWTRSSGLETTLGRLGFHTSTEAMVLAVQESVRLVLVDCQLGAQEEGPQPEGIALNAGCLHFAVVHAGASAQALADLAGRFHGVLSLPVEERALVGALAERRYIAISASERRSFGEKLDELTCGDATIARHFIRLLIDTNRTTLAALRTEFGASSWDAVASAAHCIAGSMRMLACTGMIALLVRLEAAARERDAVLARTLLAIVADSIEYLEAQLEELLDAAVQH